MLDIDVIRQLSQATLVDINTLHETVGLSGPVFELALGSCSLEDAEKLSDYFGVSLSVLTGRADMPQKVVLINDLRHISRYPYNLFETLTGKGIDWEIKKENMKLLDTVMDKILSGRQKDIIIRYYKDEQTLREIGLDYEITPERTRQILIKAIRLLRQPYYVRYITKGPHSINETEEYIKEQFSILKNKNSQLAEREELLSQKEKILTDTIRAFAEESGIPADTLLLKISRARLDKHFADCPLKDLDLSLRSFNCLARAGFLNVSDIAALLETKPEEYLQIRNFGRKSQEEVVWAIDNFFCSDKYKEVYRKTRHSRSDKETISFD